MNLAQMLMQSPSLDKFLEYNANKVLPEFRDSRAKYRAFLQVPRTIPQVAEHMGYTYAGCRASVLRMVDRGDIKKVPGRKQKPEWYQWSAK